MPCGCGGSKIKREPSSQQVKREAAGSTVNGSGRRRGEILAGSTWNGPKAKA